LANITKEHDRFVAESEERVKDAINAVDELEQEKQQLLRQLDERQRCNKALYKLITLQPVAAAS